MLTLLMLPFVVIALTAIVGLLVVLVYVLIKNALPRKRITLKDSKTKPQSGNRIPNSHDVYFVANTNAPSGKEITFDFYPTDEELHAILSLTIQSVLSVSEPIANTLLEHSTPKHWAMLLASYVDDAIDKVIGGQDLYEIYYEQRSC